jgi:hypothetical protein
MSVNTLLTIVTILGGIVGIATGLLAIRKHFRSTTPGKIVSPPSHSDNGGRFVTIRVSVPIRRRSAKYWIAVQPDDCRADGWWWPQNQPLDFDRSGSASLQRVRLGREVYDSREDIGKAFTVALFEVRAPIHSQFMDFACRDERMTLPKECALLDSVEVRRVRD